MQSDDHNLTHHVAMRDGLPNAIRPTLLEEAQQDCRAHPRYAGKARFFMNIHRQLLDGAGWLAQTVEDLLDTPGRELPEAITKSNLVLKTQRLLHFAHGHHEIEDHGYFPQFTRAYPQLEQALSLLDGDHRILDTTLNGVEAETKSLLHSPNRDQLAKLQKHTAALNKILQRHIKDEEEVIFPIFLRHG